MVDTVVAFRKIIIIDDQKAYQKANKERLEKLFPNHEIIVIENPLNYYDLIFHLLIDVDNFILGDIILDEFNINSLEYLNLKKRLSKITDGTALIEKVKEIYNEYLIVFYTQKIKVNDYYSVESDLYFFKKNADTLKEKIKQFPKIEEYLNKELNNKETIVYNGKNKLKLKMYFQKFNAIAFFEIFDKFLFVDFLNGINKIGFFMEDINYDYSMHEVLNKYNTKVELINYSEKDFYFNENENEFIYLNLYSFRTKDLFNKIRFISTSFNNNYIVNYQLAEFIAKNLEKFSLEKINNFLIYNLNDEGRFEFQKHFIYLQKQNIKNVREDIDKLLEPFKENLGNKQLINFYNTKILSVNEDTNSIDLVFTNIFDADVTLREEFFSFKILSEYIDNIFPTFEFSFITFYDKSKEKNDFDIDYNYFRYYYLKETYDDQPTRNQNNSV